MAQPGHLVPRMEFRKRVPDFEKFDAQDGICSNRFAPVSAILSPWSTVGYLTTKKIDLSLPAAVYDVSATDMEKVIIIEHNYGVV